jgi:hypothetical protein
LASLPGSGGGLVASEAAGGAYNDVLLGGEHRSERPLAEALNLDRRVVGEDVEVAFRPAKGYRLLGVELSRLRVEAEALNAREQTPGVEAGDE